jgi:NADH-quinone oxidoreductase subunit M
LYSNQADDIMLSLTIFLPLLTSLIVLALPATRPALVRGVALAGALITLVLALLLWLGFDPASQALQWRDSQEWIPSIGASYDVALDGLSLPLVVLTAVLLTAVMVYVLPQRDQRVRSHAFLFLLLATGLMGVFCARDLLLFYLFFEVGLVPMYFIIGIWGGEQRSYAAMKFFLYTRAGSLAMLLGFLALYLSMAPHTFSLPKIIEAQPLADAPGLGALVFFALLLGFGVKLPIFPLHNWLPDAHVEAPTEGSVVLAGLQLKMGAYGLVAILLPVLPQVVARFGWLLIALALISLLYGSLAALAQHDMKRLIAYTSVNHMAYVMLAVAVAAMASSVDTAQLAVNGAVFQMVSHGLLTGGVFLMVGMLQHRSGTRELSRFGGVLSVLPGYAALFGLLAFGSLGLPGLSGFVAEFQVIGASLAVSIWIAVIAVLALIVTTGLYLHLVGRLLLGQVPDRMPTLSRMRATEAWSAGSLGALSLAIGIMPGIVMPVIAVGSARLFALI